ncbi:hypothetical protein H6P81_021483 [Aristolochia fimbriata]|uniref:Uncharacterized protein n=1 Tax=Aristolochia fimbriata TaxID=158543 RepID=A0AAV7DQR9_ARIFI|nr:hypothetical protein H6P81_021483 [Aristolochia fimbriata]
MGWSGRRSVKIHMSGLACWKEGRQTKSFSVSSPALPIRCSIVGMTHLIHHLTHFAEERSQSPKKERRLATEFTPIVDGGGLLRCTGFLLATRKATCTLARVNARSAEDTY